MASFPSGETKNVRIQANHGREGMQFGEKQLPYPIQRKADLSEYPFKNTFSSQVQFPYRQPLGKAEPLDDQRDRF